MSGESSVDRASMQSEVTNYRFRKSMGWEIKASLLYQAYVQAPAALFELVLL